jgi:hypothetical protein
MPRGSEHGYGPVDGVNMSAVPKSGSDEAPCVEGRGYPEGRGEAETLDDVVPDAASVDGARFGASCITIRGRATAPLPGGLHPGAPAGRSNPG